MAERPRAANLLAERSLNAMRAADDFEYIGKRLQEIQDQSQPLQELDKYLLRRPGGFTKEEGILLADLYKCKWHLAAKFGCGSNASKKCLALGRCDMTVKT